MSDEPMKEHDTLHFTEAGHKAFGEAMAEALKNNPEAMRDFEGSTDLIERAEAMAELQQHIGENLMGNKVVDDIPVNETCTDTAALIRELIAQVKAGEDAVEREREAAWCDAREREERE